jgi:hypothetical protein
MVLLFKALRSRSLVVLAILVLFTQRRTARNKQRKKRNNILAPVVYSKPSKCQFLSRLDVEPYLPNVLRSSNSRVSTQLPPVVVAMPSASYHLSLTQPGLGSDGFDARASFSSMPPVVDMLCQL